MKYLNAEATDTYQSAGAGLKDVSSMVIQMSDGFRLKIANKKKGSFGSLSLVEIFTPQFVFIIAASSNYLTCGFCYWVGFFS